MFDLLFQRRAHRYYFAYTFMSAIGSYVYTVAMASLMFELTRSAAMVGMLALCQFGPLVAFGLFAGPLAEGRWRRLVLPLAYAALMSSGAVLALLAFMGLTNVPVLLIAAMLRGILLCIVNPASRAFLVQIFPRKSLAGALGLGSALDNAAVILGPPVAGIGIATVGYGPCFAYYTISFIGIAYLVRRWPVDTRQADADQSSIKPSKLLAEGFDYVVRDRRKLFLFACLSLVCVIPMSFSTTLPMLALETLHRDASAYGILLSLLGAGSFAGSLIVASRPRPLQAEAAFVYLAGLGLLEALLTLDLNFIAIGAVVAACGCCMTVFVVGIHGILSLETEPRLQGRVGALYTYIVFALGPLGSSASGWLGEKGGNELPFLVGAVVALSVAAAGLLMVRKPASAVKRDPTPERYTNP